MNTANDLVVAETVLNEPKLTRLLAVGKQINSLIFKINAATNYLAQNAAAPDYEAVEAARAQLVRDLSKDYAEAKELLLVVDDVIAKLENMRTSLENTHKVNVGLARIEGLSGEEKHSQFAEAAATSKARLTEIGNMISALDALDRDLGSARRTPHLCPRCTSHEVSYIISPSETGFTLFKCDSCGNAWKITEFSISAA